MSVLKLQLALAMMTLRPSRNPKWKWADVRVKFLVLGGLVMRIADIISRCIEFKPCTVKIWKPQV
jgi:hypothetical protein